MTGSVKYDGLTGDRNNEKTGDLAPLFGVEGGDLVWVAGSTQAPEDREVLDIYRRVKGRFPKLRLILVPRQRHAFDAVAKLVQGPGSRSSAAAGCRLPSSIRTRSSWWIRSAKFCRPSGEWPILRSSAAR